MAIIFMSPTKYQIVVKLKSKQETVEKTGDYSYTVKTRAEPVEGKANQRIIELMAKELGVAKSNISIIAGVKSKKKVIAVKS